MKETLFNEKLIAREFGSHLFSVNDLLQWAESKNLHPPNIALLEEYEFVQVECFLFEIYKRAVNVTPSETLAIILASNIASKNPLAIEQPAYFLGGDAEVAWRKIVKEAIESGELVILDFGSKLPAFQAMKQETLEEKIDYQFLATRTDLIEAFGKFTGMNQTWFDNLTDTPKLMAARKYKGISGRRHAEPLFCPYEVMQWLIDPKRRKGTKLSISKGWGLLKSHFPKVHNAKSIGDPNDD